MDLFGNWDRYTPEAQAWIARFQAVQLGLPLANFDQHSPRCREEFLAAIRDRCRSTDMGAQNIPTAPASAQSEGSGKPGRAASGGAEGKWAMPCTTPKKEVLVIGASDLRDKLGRRIGVGVRYFFAAESAQTAEAAWEASPELREAWRSSCPNSDARATYLLYARACLRDGSSPATCPFDSDGNAIRASA